MDLLKKYWPLLLTLVGAISPAVSPAIAAFWSGHPQTVAIIAAAYASFKWLLPSPLNK